MPRSEFRLALTTTSDPAQAESLARLLVEKRLAACVNIVTSVRSIYRWEGKLTSDGEQLLLIKTRAELIPKLKKEIERGHAYDCPEFLVLEIADGSDGYLEWLAASLEAPRQVD